jgi:4-diphosphocytidyl-2-C-methyl-D-erythritol kinase
MIVFPNAKINIGLNVIEKRDDGFHNIESCFFPVAWKDALEVVESKEFAFSSSGIAIPNDSNIVIDAYNLLKEKHSLPNIAIHLHKGIPIGAGLGGGSADGAFMLKLLNEMFKLNHSQSKLEDYAAQLGSDCPFFIDNEPKFVEGTGNVFSNIALDLSDLYLALVYPDIHIETKSAYHGLVPNKPEYNLKEVLEVTMLSEWQEVVKNDFEKTTDPAVLDLKQKLYDSGAIYASMSGSGSAVYGLYTKKPDIDSIPGSKLVSKL